MFSSADYTRFNDHHQSDTFITAISRREAEVTIQRMELMNKLDKVHETANSKLDNLMQLINGLQLQLQGSNGESMSFEVESVHIENDPVLTDDAVEFGTPQMQAIQARADSIAMEDDIVEPNREDSVLGEVESVVMEDESVLVDEVAELKRPQPPLLEALEDPIRLEEGPILHDDETLSTVSNSMWADEVSLSENNYVTEVLCVDLVLDDDGFVKATDKLLFVSLPPLVDVNSLSELEGKSNKNIAISELRSVWETEDVSRLSVRCLPPDVFVGPLADAFEESIRAFPNQEVSFHRGRGYVGRLSVGGYHSKPFDRGRMQSWLFCSYHVEEWLKRHGPLDALVDGANLGNASQLTFSPSRKFPLAALHRNRVSSGLAQHLNKKSLLERKKGKALNATPQGSNDERYWPSAGASSFSATNDDIIDHLFELLGNSFFHKWKEKLQVRLQFSSEGLLTFPMSSPYSIVIRESLRSHEAQPRSLPSCLLYPLWKPLAVNVPFEGMNMVASYVGPMLSFQSLNFSSTNDNSPWRYGMVLALFFFASNSVESMSRGQLAQLAVFSLLSASPIVGNYAFEREAWAICGCFVLVVGGAAIANKAIEAMSERGRKTVLKSSCFPFDRGKRASMVVGDGSVVAGILLLHPWGQGCFRPRGIVMNPPQLIRVGKGLNSWAGLIRVGVG